MPAMAGLQPRPAGGCPPAPGGGASSSSQGEGAQRATHGPPLFVPRQQAGGPPVRPVLLPQNPQPAGAGAAPQRAAPGLKRKNYDNGRGAGGPRQGQQVQPAAMVQPAAVPVVEAPQPLVVAMPTDSVVPGQVAKKVKVYCFKCKAKSHATKDCNVELYCYICDNSKHSLSKCPVLKLPRPTTFVAGFGEEDLMFTQFPDSVFKAQLAPNVVPTACVMVHGEAVTAEAVERQVSRICPAPSWKWEAVEHGVICFLLGVPSMEDL